MTGTPHRAARRPRTIAWLSVLLITAFSAAAPAGPTAAAPAGPTAAGLRLSGPYVYDNLALYLLHGPDTAAGRTPTPLARALAEKKVVVHETGSVNRLAIENLSDEEVYVQAGEIVKGGQQDRVLDSDLVLPPKSGKRQVGAHCVEAGRWSARGVEAVERFSSAETQAAGKALKLANYRGAQGRAGAGDAGVPRRSPDAAQARQHAGAGRPDAQREVWAQVAALQNKLQGAVGGEVRSPASASSLPLTLEHERVRGSVDAYVEALRDLVQAHPDARGLAFAINGAPNSADVYASRALFLELWPKLLRAAAVEALAERPTRPAAHTPPSLPALRARLDEPLRTAADERPAGPFSVARESAGGLLIETRAPGTRGYLHRSLVLK